MIGNVYQLQIALGGIKGGEDFDAAAFTLLPQGECVLHYLGFVRKPTRSDDLPDERLLIESELNFHIQSVRVGQSGVKPVLLAVAEVGLAVSEVVFVVG